MMIKSRISIAIFVVFAFMIMAFVAPGRHILAMASGVTGGKTGELLETLVVTNERPEKVRTSFATQPGSEYIIEASGVFSDWDGHTDGVDAVWCYAEWRCGKHGLLWNQLRIDGKGMPDLAGHAIPYNPNHVYRIQVQGTGAPFEFHMSDAQDSAGDNHGGIAIKIWEK